MLTNIEVSVYVLGAAAAISTIFSAAFLSTGHRDVGLWTACAAIILTILGGFAWYQHRLWKNDEASTRTEPLPKSARVIFVDNRLVLPPEGLGPVAISFGLINTGNADATVKIWDRTYFFSVHPEQTVFSYQLSPPEEVHVPAIPNAIVRGEMRYEFAVTPEKLDALKAGKARLFFFARGQYSDDSGKAHPLQFSGMYDATFAGNLVAVPTGIVFR